MKLAQANFWHYSMIRRPKQGPRRAPRSSCANARQNKVHALFRIVKIVTAARDMLAVLRGASPSAALKAVGPLRLTVSFDKQGPCHAGSLPCQLPIHAYRICHITGQRAGQRRPHRSSPPQCRQNRCELTAIKESERGAAPDQGGTFFDFIAPEMSEPILKAMTA